MQELVRLVLASYCPSSSTQHCLPIGSSHQVLKDHFLFGIWFWELSGQFLENWESEHTCVRHRLERLELAVTKKEEEVVDQLVRIERMEARQKMLKQDIWRIRNDQNRKRTEKTQTWPLWLVSCSVWQKDSTKKTFFSSLDFSEPDTADLYRSKRDIYQQVGFPHFCTPFGFYLFVSRTAIMLFIFSEESRGGSQPGKPGNLEI